MRIRIKNSFNLRDSMSLERDFARNDISSYTFVSVPGCVVNFNTVI